jgi:hypothetical protein
MLKINLDKETIIKFIGVQNVLLTIFFFLSDVETAKWWHFIKLSIVIPYRNIHYLIKGKPLYLIELCYVLAYVNWFYLLCDLFILDEEETYYRYLLYNNSYLYSSVILPIASFATKDIITFRKTIANTRPTIHFENGALFMILQKYYLDNNINTDMSYYNYILALFFYCAWLYLYNKIMYYNLYIKENPDEHNMITKVYKSNIYMYNIQHFPLCILGITLAFSSYYYTWIQQVVLGISYLGMTYYTAINQKY